MTADTLEKLEQKMRERANVLTEKGWLVAADLREFADTIAALRQQQGRELPDIEVMREVFDSLPTATAKTAYAAVKTYIDICNHAAGRPSAFDAFAAAPEEG